MKTNFEDEFEKVMTEEKEIPANVRERLDQTYRMIEEKSPKKKKRSMWKGVTAAACAMVLAGIVFSSEEVRANLQEFFSFGNGGVEKAVSEGFVQESNSTATDAQIDVTLQQNFSDATHLGLSFQLAFEDPTILERDISEINMDYRIKNGNGEYIFEFIPDTKPLKGHTSYLSGGADSYSIVDAKKGIVQYDVIMSSNAGSIPNMEDAVVEVESINVFYAEEGLKKIDGEWALAVANAVVAPPVEYAMKEDPSSMIQVSSAKANPTSFHVTFTVDEVFEDESPFMEMKMMDGEGIEYGGDGFRMTTTETQTIISTNFPISSYDHFDQLKIVIEEVGEVVLLQK